MDGLNKKRWQELHKKLVLELMLQKLGMLLGMRLTASNRKT
jgi:hypothetical protein